jgi:hypothetical protein
MLSRVGKKVRLEPGNQLKNYGFAVFRKTLRAEGLLPWVFVTPRSQIPEGYAHSSLRDPSQNSSQQQFPYFFSWLLFESLVPVTS